MDVVAKPGWAHLHLPRLKTGDPDVISLKIPGRHISYVAWLSMDNVSFRVHESGRQRCIRENARNVHAWVIGDVTLCGAAPMFLELAELDMLSEGWSQALYDPFRGGSFVDSVTFEPIHSAWKAFLRGKNVYYKEL